MESGVPKAPARECGPRRGKRKDERVAKFDCESHVNSSNGTSHVHYR